MARPWRIQYPGAIYHVIARGNNQQNIFITDADQKDFLKLIERGVKRFHLKIFAFCLMDNHYHLFVQTPEANLSAAMHWLNATYTIRFHRRHKHSGHLLQGRFKSVLVTSDEHWRRLSFYIHLNPLRGGITASPEEYEWSSLRDYLAAKPRFSWLCREEVLAQYRGSRLSRRRRYREDCLGVGSESPDFWEMFRDSVVIGSKEVLALLVEKYLPLGDPRYVSDYTRLKRSEIDVERELARVAKIFRVNAEDLKTKKRNFPARSAAYYHLVEICGISQARVAQAMGVSPMAVSFGIKHLRNLISSDSVLARKIKKLTLNYRPDPKFR